MAGNEDLREQVSTLRADHAALGQRVTGMENQLSGLRTDLDDKHKQNRMSIHDLRQVAQETRDEIHKMALQMTAFFSSANTAGGIKSKIINGAWLVIGGGIVAYIGKMIEKAIH